MIYKYIIVEDRPGSLLNLQTALKPYKEFTEIGTANTLSKGISQTLKLRPHIVFLDVELGEEKGFDLIKEIRTFTTELPFIIMTTDYDKYAKKAVNSDVLYFLDKPIDPDELELALQKFEKRFLELKHHITIKNTEGHYFMQLDDIVYIQSDNNCSRIFRKGQPFMTITKTLKEMEAILPPPFIRIHKSYIVNAKYICMLNTSKKIVRILDNILDSSPETEFPISVTYLENVRQTLLTAK